MEDVPLPKKAKFEFSSIREQLLNNYIIDENNATICSNLPSTTMGEDSFNSFVDDIAQLLLVKNFVIVQGPPGSGKTHSAKIVSEKYGICLNILQISSQIDAKSLYGTYTCTEVPGEFIWKPSKFTQYLEQECLILLENIDHGGPDLASAILHFIENGFIDLPNGIKININKKCRILGSIEENAQQISSIPLILQEYPYKVIFVSPTFDQLNNILEAKYPKLANIREKLTSLFFTVSDVIKTKKASIDRSLNTKDLFRAMSRLNFLLPSLLNDPHSIFLELIDVWAINLTINSLKLEVANLISEALSLAKEEQHFLLNIRHPKFTVDNENVEIGRIKLERRQMTEINIQPSNFVLTRDATSLLERLCVSVVQRPPEPILLTGETGVGKTSSVQYLAYLLRVPLRIPTSPLNILRPLADEYFCLFKASFDLEKNSKFLANVNKCFNSQRFGDFLQLIWKSSTRICRKLPEARTKWIELAKKASRMLKCFSNENAEAWRRRMFFTYMKGVVTQAVEQGHWLLVDEINLASSECLDVLVELLEQPSDFHPNFRLFACMNHATDVGKRQLLSGIRSKFTEILVCETSDIDQFHVLIRGHLPSIPKNLVDGILNFYLDVCTCFPHKFSLRTLSRSLTLAGEINCNGSLLNSLLHALHLSFSSQLGIKQREKMCQLLASSFGLSKIQFSLLTIKPGEIDDSNFVLIEGFPVPRGPEQIINDGNYVFTSSVKENMKLLASVVSTRKFPILLEGETSAGKTSMVVHLAKMSGNCVYRINNHEHSDIQEYIGTYAPDEEGRLVFAEGLLLKALRFGHWIILDELNLAPSAILEALNRLLDDNRELFVPELNCTIKAHPRFQLFATQNPYGVYSGRNRLSRAFLNRFMVIQFDTIPLSELPQIVQQRCGIAPKQAELAVNVLQELRSRRAISKIFSSSDGLMTLRDLFRWANRLTAQKNHDDWRQLMADHGYFVLATRCRTTQDENEVIHVLEQKLQRKIDLDFLFGENSPFIPSNVIIPQHIVLTKQFRRTLILCSEAWKCHEPILLVGDTGCGKTSAVHLFGNLLSINCHERTDASDLLGNVRPALNSQGGSTFRWQDGIVVQAMRLGQCVLIDEISLAADSVLERLNSLLESERTILLTNPASSSISGESSSIGQLVKAKKGFQLVATMNPGNDHGKRELSRALRNRFTEIWVPAKYDRDDALEIIRQRLLSCNTSSKLSNELTDRIARIFIEFTEFFSTQLSDIIKYLFRILLIIYIRFIPSLRDLVGLAELFMEMLNTTCDSFNSHTIAILIYHSIEATFLDALGVLPQRMIFNRSLIIEQSNISPSLENDNFILNNHGLFIGPFSIKFPNEKINACKFPKGYSLNSPSTRQNLLRIARAFSSKKPIMLEGSPGSGKSSLVMALAAATGHRLIRLNLSEQTDIYDLFGTDVPVTHPDANYSTFEWKDGPVLKAIREGTWILLDEMNLASQSVLEGLNSCFDFRKNIYISELNRTFDVDTSKCRFFACQNPHSQGGDRRALPKSFVNRFISIFIEEMTDNDFIFILTEYSKTIANGNLYLSEELISKIILINKLFKETNNVINSGCEFNLRDLFRFLEATVMFGGNVDFSFDLVYLSRLSSKDIKQKVINTIYNRVFYPRKWIPSLPFPKIDLHLPILSVGNVKLSLNETSEKNLRSCNLCLLATQMELFEKVAACMQANWLALLIGPSHSGKRSVIKNLAHVTGKKLYTMRLTSSTDALDLLGSFEQIQLNSLPSNLHLEQNENFSLDEFELPKDYHGGLCFKWVESIFLRAFRDGHWLLIEDVNCCNSAVLDCLNSCLESTNGELLLPIDDSQVIHRHPDFRIFFSMNPRNGQISRAMRNRTLEIQFCVDQLSHYEQLWSKNPYDVFSIIFQPCFELQRNFQKSITFEKELLLQCFNSLLTNNLSCEYLLKCAALLYAKILSDSSINFNEILKLFLLFLSKQNSLPLTISSIPCYLPLLRPSLNNKLSTEIFDYYFNCWFSISKFVLNTPSTAFVQMALVFPSELILESDYLAVEPLFDLLTSIFNNFELHLSVKKIYEQMRDFVSKIRFNDGDIFSIIDELLISTFDKFYSIHSLWCQLQSNITNSTFNGEQYLQSLRSSTCLCMPFGNYDLMNKFFQRWNDEQNMLVDHGQRMEESNSLFSPLKQHLIILLNKIDHLFFNSSTSTSLLNWINSNCNERLFLFSRFMSSSSFLMQVAFNEQPQTLYSMLDDCAFITHFTNSLLWSRLNYNDNLLKHVKVYEMFDVLNQLERTSELFWDMFFTSKSLKKTNNILWSECEKNFIVNLNNTQSLTSVESILAKIKSLTPTKDFLDHIFYVYEHKNYLQIKGHNLEYYFSALRDFLQLTISKTYELDDVCKITSNHSNFIAAISKSRQATISSLNNLENEFNFWTNDPSVYRIELLGEDALDYKKNFQKNVVNELINCTTALSELFTPNFLKEIHNCQALDQLDLISDLEHYCCLLANAIQTVQVLKKRLCSLTCSNILTFILFPDIFIPYLFSLNCLVICLSEHHKQAKERFCFKRQNQIVNVLLQSFEKQYYEKINSNILLNQLTILISNDINIPPQQKLPILLWNYNKINDKNLTKKYQVKFLHWIFTYWELWYEEHAKTKIEQLYHIKKKKRNNSEDMLENDEVVNSNDDLEDDNEEFNNYLPDFSNLSENQPKEISDNTSVEFSLNGDDIYSTLQTILSSSEQPKFPFLNFMCVLNQLPQKLIHCSSLINENFAFHQLFQINELQKQLKTQFPVKQHLHHCSPLNVYKECEPSALFQCCEALESLKKAAMSLKNEFPENAQLILLLSSLETFNNDQAGFPMMKHATQLERVLEHAEAWESISDRVHSLREQMCPLQELLVEWRRQEVQCWNELVNNFRKGSSQLAVLVSWPLFKYALELKDDGNKLLLMFIEWMQNSTLGDFETRLWTGQLLSHCLFLLEDDNYLNVNERSKLSNRILCIVEHFAQFKDQVKDLYKQLYTPIEKDLHNFTTVVRYNDLNLCSVRESTKRARVQLIRILRKFKEMYNESISLILFDKMPKIPNQALELFPSSFTFSFENLSFDPTLFNMINNFDFKFDKRLQNLVAIDELSSIKIFAVDLLQLLMNNVSYQTIDKSNETTNSDSIDSENEKIHGRALFERQQRFSLLIRTLKRFGLGSRRSHKLDSEKLTIETLTQITPNINDLFVAGDTINLLFRHNIASRNVFMRKFASWRHSLQNTPHLSQQLSPFILENLRGTTEFGLHWIFQAINGLTTTVALEVIRLRDISKCFETELVNIKYSKDSSNVLPTHKQITEIFVQHCNYIQNIYQITDRMSKILLCCPKEHYNQTSLKNIQEPLGGLRQSDLHFSQLNKDIDNLFNLISKLYKLNDKKQEMFLCLPLETTNNLIIEENIWNKSCWFNYSQNVCSLIENIKSLLINSEHIKYYFPDDYNLILEFINKIHLLFNDQKELIQPTNSQINEVSFNEIQQILLLRLQNFFNYIESLLNSDINRLDSVKGLIEYFGKNSFKSSDLLIQTYYSNFFSKSLNALPETILDKLFTLSKGISKLYQRLLHYLCEFIFQLISLNEHWVAIGCHLLTNGFVNPIPKAGPVQGDDKKVENMCGFGDGDMTSDAKDVGGELEAMEQIEGLKGGTENESNSQNEMDQSNENIEQQKLPEVDNPIDVEDDFGGCIEGLDVNDGEEDEQGDNDNDEEEDHNADWNFGEVDEPEEKQLDPKLWEQNENEINNIDDDDNVANNGVETDDLVAAHNQQQKQQKNSENTEQAEGTQEQEEENREKGETDEDIHFSNEMNVTEENCEEMDHENNKNSDDFEETEKEMEETEERNELGKENDGEFLNDDAEEKQNQNEELDVDNDEEEDHNAEWNFGEVDEPEEEQLDPKPWEQNENQINNIDDDDNVANNGVETDDLVAAHNQQQKQQKNNENMEQAEGNKEQEENREKGETGEDIHFSNEMNVTEENCEEMDHENNKNSDDFEETEKEMEETEERNELGKENDGEFLNDDAEENNISAVGTSTFEQANRTRTLFDSTLRRLRISELKNELAENISDNDNINEENQKAANVEDLNMDIESNASIEVIDNSKEKEGCDVYINFPERFNFNFESTSNDITTIDRLCKEFDRIERENTNSANEDDIHQLQTKWAIISEGVNSLAFELTESLRAIIAPTVANKLEGDYRTGKRLNMRRLIAYIASDYRKDQIWMRRTKCAKRNYQVCIAVDNSQSMKYNHFTEITCNSLCLIERALRQLEIGQLAVCSFGSNIQLLSDFSTAEDLSLGLRILQNFKFDQQRTDISQLLEFSVELFKKGRECSLQTPEQMLIILGDGRDVLSNGVTNIKKYLEHLQHDRVAVLFLIMDTAQQSITEVKVADFANGGCTFKPYLECFPFPIYALVRNTNALPNTISEAIRQWFDYTKND